jgi:hypothetical protein
MNGEIGTEVAQFPGKEYINWIFLAVQGKMPRNQHGCYSVPGPPPPRPFLNLFIPIASIIKSVLCTFLFLISTTFSLLFAQFSHLQYAVAVLLMLSRAGEQDKQLEE